MSIQLSLSRAGGKVFESLLFFVLPSEKNYQRDASEIGKVIDNVIDNVL
jgi:molybdopterin biosynthesis enzyme MoaB